MVFAGQAAPVCGGRSCTNSHRPCAQDGHNWCSAESTARTGRWSRPTRGPCRSRSMALWLPAYAFDGHTGSSAAGRGSRPARRNRGQERGGDPQSTRRPGLSTIIPPRYTMTQSDENTTVVIVGVVSPGSRSAPSSCAKQIRTIRRGTVVVRQLRPVDLVHCGPHAWNCRRWRWRLAAPGSMPRGSFPLCVPRRLVPFPAGRPATR